MQRSRYNYTSVCFNRLIVRIGYVLIVPRDESVICTSFNYEGIGRLVCCLITRYLTIRNALLEVGTGEVVPVHTHHATKTYREVEVLLNAFLTFAQDGGECSV
jgi:hypothetical protein